MVRSKYPTKNQIHQQISHQSPVAKGTKKLKHY